MANTNSKVLHPKRAAVILASLRNQLAWEVRYGSLTIEEWRDRMNKAVALGVTVPAVWLDESRFPQVADGR